MAKVTANVAGMDNLARRFARLRGPEAQKILRAAASAGAVVIRNKARQKLQSNGSVKTGALLKSVASRRHSKAGRPGFEEYEVGVFKISKSSGYTFKSANALAVHAGKTLLVSPPTYYWRFLEFGTVRMGAKPFLRPSLESSQQAAFDAVKAKLDKTITKVEGL